MRREDWPERLIEALDAHARLPFSWGTSDCYLMPIDCAVAVTGFDPCPEVRGTYDSRLGAAKALVGRGFPSIADAFASVYPPIPPALGQRGDIGVIKLPEGGYAGVVFVGSLVVGKDAEGGGNRRVSRSLVTQAFRVA